MATKSKQVKKIEIIAPNFQVLEVVIRGTAPLMIHRWGSKAKRVMEEKQTSENKVKQPRKPKDYVAEFNDARYVSEKGWDGFYAGALRLSMIGGVRFGPDLSMVQARGLLFVLAEGFCKEDGTPLVRIRGGKAKHDKRPVKISQTTDIRNRPRYDSWWSRIRIQYDADLLTEQDVLNLLVRAGISVGLCEGRPISKDSAGIGFGTFMVEGVNQTRSRKKAA